MVSSYETFVFYLLIVFTSIFGMIILNGNLLLYTYDSMQDIKDDVLNKCYILLKYIIDTLLANQFTMSEIEDGTAWKYVNAT